MQPLATPAHRLHWIPIAPSWLVAGGLALLTAMPHKLPATARQAMQKPLGLAAFAAIVAWLYTVHPVLSIALALLVVSVNLHRHVEGFANPPTFIKDKVAKKSVRWYDEDVLMEDPHMIQDRTEENTLLKDHVDEQEAHPWFSESTLEEHPTGIQERTVSDPNRTPDY